MTDLEAVWFGNGSELVRRLQALTAEMRLEGHGHAADLVTAVLECDYNPLPDQLPELGDPSSVRLRSAVRGRGYFRLPRDVADVAPRRACEPGA